MNTAEKAVLPTTFRDPAGQLTLFQDHAIRKVFAVGVDNYSAFRKLEKICATGTFIETQEVLSSENEIVLCHPRVPFISYPHEWSPQMLYKAAELTLSIATQGALHNLGLKDATPHNIQFIGKQPVFVDVLSVEERNEKDPVWIAYGQFCRTFLIPLYVSSKFGTTINSIFLSSRDGIKPSDIYPFLNPLEKISPLALSLITAPSKLSKKHTTISNIKHFDKNTANYILSALLKRTLKILQKLEPKSNKQSEWVSYSKHNNYSIADQEAKKLFIQSVIEKYPPKITLDIGCNIGLYSQIAAANGSYVVAIDRDESVIDELIKTAGETPDKIIPLVIDICRPSPPLGWLNSEQMSFLERCKDKFDMVFMLAIIHHLTVTERIPLSHIAKLAKNLTNDNLIIEFISNDDPMFKAIASMREHLYYNFTKENFEFAFCEYFDLVKEKLLPSSHRILYHFKKKHS